MTSDTVFILKPFDPAEELRRDKVSPILGHLILITQCNFGVYKNISNALNFRNIIS